MQLNFMFKKIENLHRITRNNYTLFIFLPLFVNYLINQVNKGLINSLNQVNYFNLFSTILFFFFLYSLGNNISIALNIKNKSFSIVLYFFSFFIFDNFLLFFFTQIISFNQIFLITNIFG